MTINAILRTLGPWKMLASTLLIAICMNDSVHSQVLPRGADPFGSEAPADPFPHESSKADAFVKKFKGVVRLTYVIRVSNVIAHVRSAAAVVMSSQGSVSIGTSFPVLATSESVFAPPEEDWFKDAPADSRSYSVYVQDPYDESLGDQTTTIQLYRNMGSMGGREGGLGSSRSVSSGSGAPAGYGFGGASQDHRRSVYGFVSLPGIGDYLFPLCESKNLDDIRTTSGGLAFVVATTTLNNVRMEETLLLKTKASDNIEETEEVFSFRDSTTPELQPSNRVRMAGEVQVSKSGFKALSVALPGSEASQLVSSTEILAAYIQHLKKAKTNSPELPKFSDKESKDGVAQTQKSETNKLLADIVAAYRSSNTENEKGRALAQLEHVLSEQFDAHRSVKKLEIQELRERLNELEQQEELRGRNKKDILSAKLKQLIRE